MEFYSLSYKETQKEAEMATIQSSGKNTKNPRISDATSKSCSAQPRMRPSVSHSTKLLGTVRSRSVFKRQIQGLDMYSNYRISLNINIISIRKYVLGHKPRKTNVRQAHFKLISIKSIILWPTPYRCNHDHKILQPCSSSSSA